MNANLFKVIYFAVHDFLYAGDAAKNNATMVHHQIYIFY